MLENSSMHKIDNNHNYCNNNNIVKNDYHKNGFVHHQDHHNDKNKDDERIVIQNINKNLSDSNVDILSHICLGNMVDDLKEMFGDVRFVCMGGTGKRMLKFANYIKDVIGYKLPTGHTFQNMSVASDRYEMYKIGPVISISHGMGCPSISIVLNEIMKLVHYAKCKDVTFFRMGTCGGIGLKPGTVVITKEAVDGMFRPEYRQIILGKEVARKTSLNMDLANDLLAIGKNLKENSEVDIEDVVCGRTLCADDFYEGQGRLDGVFCDYSIEEKMDYLYKCQQNGVCNIEMESLCFTSFFNHANLKAAIACVTLLDRLKGDQLTLTPKQYTDFQERPIKLIGEYIKRQLSNNK